MSIIDALLIWVALAATCLGVFFALCAFNRRRYEVKP